MTRRISFPKKSRGQGLEAEHVNKMGREIATNARLHTGSGILKSQENISSINPPMIRVMEVVQTIPGNVKGKPRYLRHYDDNGNLVGSPTWETTTDVTHNGLTLDLNALGTTVGLGDKIVAMFDPQSQKWIPLVVAANVGIGEANTDLDPGEAGTIIFARWSGAIFMADGGGETMRNTSGVAIESGAKVAWQYHTDSNQYLCSPLECLTGVA